MVASSPTPSPPSPLHVVLTFARRSFYTHSHLDQPTLMRPRLQDTLDAVIHCRAASLHTTPGRTGKAFLHISALTPRGSRKRGIAEISDLTGLLDKESTWKSLDEPMAVTRIGEDTDDLPADALWSRRLYPDIRNPCGWPTIAAEKLVPQAARSITDGSARKARVPRRSLRQCRRPWHPWHSCPWRLGCFATVETRVLSRPDSG